MTKRTEQDTPFSVPPTTFHRIRKSAGKFGLKESEKPGLCHEKYAEPPSKKDNTKSRTASPALPSP